ncbi:MAG: hypothetical protein Q8M94_17265, partial [Ignavibacteria bacterium]|nr:hypothetical protein [Ignavibacteria bacterium]
MNNTKKGVPQIYFSQRPYSAWNYDCIIRTKFTGLYSYTGIVGLAIDKNNYILGYITNEKYGIAKIRNGKKTILIEEANVAIVPNISLDVRFWHRDGLFGIEVKEIDDPWPTRGSQLVYSWLTANDTIAISDDLFHVGIYTFINPPRFRTTGFRSSQAIIPVLPLDMDDETSDSDFVTDFPASGSVDIEGTIYTYGGKNQFFTDIDNDKRPRGPYQLRAFYDWTPPFTSDPGGGYAYQGGMAVEFWLFDWLDGATYSGKYDGAILG